MYMEIDGIPIECDCIRIFTNIFRIVCREGKKAILIPNHACTFLEKRLVALESHLFVLDCTPVVHLSPRVVKHQSVSLYQL